MASTKVPFGREEPAPPQCVKPVGVRDSSSGIVRRRALPVAALAFLIPALALLTSQMAGAQLPGASSSSVIASSSPALPLLPPDLNADDAANSSDAQILWQSFAWSALVGGRRESVVDCTDPANLAPPHFPMDARAQSLRGTWFSALRFLMPSTDASFRQMICKANNWRLEALQRGGDINGDGRIDTSDAVIMYYSYTLRGSLGNGFKDTQADACNFDMERLGARKLYLSGHRGPGPRTDAHYRNLMARANALFVNWNEFASVVYIENGLLLTRAVPSSEVVNCPPADIIPAQTPTLATWEYEPLLRMSVGGAPVADPGGMYRIPGSAATTPVRLELSIRVTQTSGNLSSAWSEFGGNLGIEGFKGSIVFSATGTATTADVAAALGSATSRMNSAGTAPLVDAAGSSADSADRWRLWWGQNVSRGGSPELDGMQCTPANPGTDHSCEVSLGHIEFTPNLPAGGGLSIRLAGYDRTDGAPEILPFEPLLRDVETTVSLASTSVTLLDDPELSQSGDAVPDVNGDGEVNANDALILYYAFSLRGDLGNGR